MVIIVKKKDELKVTAKEYVQTLTELVDEISAAQLRAAVAASKELVRLYWFIGKTISKKQEESNWGDSFLESLAKDIQRAFPRIKGFSRRNIGRMAAFYRAYANLGTAVPKLENLPFFSIPWGHNAILVERVENPEDRLWYAQKTLQEGWSRITLEEHIRKSSKERIGKAITNFNLTLPEPQSHLAHESLKDPYLFDFLILGKKYNEKEVEQGLIDHIQKFLLELDKGFAFVGRQEHLVVEDTDFYIDLLFYHTKLHCYRKTAVKPIALAMEI